MNRCYRCQAELDAGGSCLECSCIVDNCLRGRYSLEGRCKAHADAWRYAQMRKLEFVLRRKRDVRVRCLARTEYLEAYALSEVRVVRLPLVPTRGRWPSVLVQVDGHNLPVEWPAIDVEVAA